MSSDEEPRLRGPLLRSKGSSACRSRRQRRLTRTVRLWYVLARTLEALPRTPSRGSNGQASRYWTPRHKPSRRYHISNLSTSLEPATRPKGRSSPRPTPAWLGRSARRADRRVARCGTCGRWQPWFGGFGGVMLGQPRTAPPPPTARSPSSAARSDLFVGRRGRRRRWRHVRAISSRRRAMPAARCAMSNNPARMTQNHPQTVRPKPGV